MLAERTGERDGIMRSRIILVVGGVLLLVCGMLPELRGQAQPATVAGQQAAGATEPPRAVYLMTNDQVVIRAQNVEDQRRRSGSTVKASDLWSSAGFRRVGGGAIRSFIGGRQRFSS